MNRADPREVVGRKPVDPRRQADTADPQEGLATPQLRVSPQNVGTSKQQEPATATTDRFGQFQRAVPSEPTEGPQVVSPDGEVNAAQAYTGPAVLSRNYTLSRNVGQQAVKWNWTVGASQVFDSGVIGNSTPASTTAQGTTAMQVATSTAAPTANGSSATSGRQLNWGFSARHAWKRDLLTANYTGTNTNYGAGSNYNGSSQSLSIQYGRILSNRIRFSANTGAQILARSASLENSLAHSQVSIADINLAFTPVPQVTDQGSKNLSVQSSLSWQRSSRMSIVLGMGYNATSRAAGAFGGGTSLGSAGVSEQLDLNYRRSAKNTVGLFYSHATFTYSHHLNLANTNSLGGVYSLSLSRATQLSIRAGFAVLQNESLQQVRTNPAFAMLVGSPGGVVYTYRVLINPDVSAQITHAFARGRAVHLAYNQGIAGGGGGGASATSTTSTQRAFVGGYSMKLLKQYRLSATAGWSDTSAVSAGSTTDSIQPSVSGGSNNFLGINISRSFSHGLSTQFSVDYRTFAIPGNPTLRTQLRITTGISWGPGEGKLW